MEIIGKTQSFEEGLIWNYAGIVILALSGILFNALIIFFYTPDALGIFNRVYAYYIVVSQICAWGVHMSIVRTTSLGSDREEQRLNLSSAVFLVLGISGIMCFLVKILLSLMGRTDFTTSLQHVIPAFFFSQ